MSSSSAMLAPSDWLAYEYLDRRTVTEKDWVGETEGVTEPGYAFISKSV